MAVGDNLNRTFLTPEMARRFNIVMSGTTDPLPGGRVTLDRRDTGKAVRMQGFPSRGVDLSRGETVGQGFFLPSVAPSKRETLPPPTQSLARLFGPPPSEPLVSRPVLPDPSERRVLPPPTQKPSDLFKSPPLMTEADFLNDEEKVLRQAGQPLPTSKLTPPEAPSAEQIERTGKNLSTFGKIIQDPGLHKFLAAMGMAIAPHNTALGEFAMKSAEADAQRRFRETLEAGGEESAPQSGLSAEGRRSVIQDIREKKETERREEREDTLLNIARGRFKLEKSRFGIEEERERRAAEEFEMIKRRAPIEEKLLKVEFRRAKVLLDKMVEDASLTSQQAISFFKRAFPEVPVSEELLDESLPSSFVKDALFLLADQHYNLKRARLARSGGSNLTALERTRLKQAENPNFIPTIRKRKAEFEARIADSTDENGISLLSDSELQDLREAIFDMDMLLLEFGESPDLPAEEDTTGAVTTEEEPQVSGGIGNPFTFMLNRLGIK